MITFLHVTFYRWIFYPLMIVASRIAAPFVPKIKLGILARKKQNGIRPWLKTPTGTKPIWFHCSSGELEYAKPVIQLLRQRHPREKILLTYFSPSVEKSAKNFAAVDFALPIPLDHPLSLNKFLDHHQPKLLALSRTDTWPDLVYLCHQRKIPSILFSATLSSSKAKFKNPFSRAYHRWIYNHLSAVLCVSADDKSHFEQMGVTVPCTVTGDTRYDQVLYRLANPKPLKNELKPGPNEIVFVAGSTWAEDEAVLVPAAAQAARFGVRIILAPHEPSPSHLEALERQLRAAKVPSVRYTKTPSWEPGQVLLIDTVGILAELYQWATVAFVGNSFKRHAIHSVMEPLGCGCITLMGPFHHNNREALSFKKIGGATPPIGFAQTIHNSKEFESKLLELTNHPQLREMKEKIKTEVRSRSGASQRVLSEIESRLS